MNDDCIITNPIDDDACIIMDALESVIEYSYNAPLTDEK